MKRIFKYPLPVADYQVLEIPKIEDTPVQILSVGTQYEKIVMYAIIDDESTKLKNVEVLIFGTGHPMEDWKRKYDVSLDEYRFVSTVSLRGGSIMFHVFVKEN